ncbi:KOW motif-containing protein [Deinococcus cellulosilyticus]|uniref:KOW domain-containing protein n=1 Tax=Deinococcus cellulosilyticus (strain DSM 18568 / NBRC 106333 / KACC 11606 / 5516J-15) TaxID=1223518 RepID=A0A511MW11_DEIC1|nr:KOW motif-containing protein [Deinococcus cellulosilyticus]GEM44763.1 hypothetical protein DC3_03980 [Deinococcus cellulosilyticus NBRC 106333 = KACC 11606]
MTSVHTKFQVGDEVRIIQGRFQGYEGKIQDYDPLSNEYLVVYGDERRSHAGQYRAEELSPMHTEVGHLPLQEAKCCNSCLFYRQLSYIEKLDLEDNPREEQCTHPFMTDLQGQAFWVRDDRNFGCLLHQRML